MLIISQGSGASAAAAEAAERTADKLAAKERRLKQFASRTSSRIQKRAAAPQTAAPNKVWPSASCGTVAWTAEGDRPCPSAEASGRASIATEMAGFDAANVSQLFDMR